MLFVIEAFRVGDQSVTEITASHAEGRNDFQGFVPRLNRIYYPACVREHIPYICVRLRENALCDVLGNVWRMDRLPIALDRIDVLVSIEIPDLDSLVVSQGVKA